MGCTNTWIAGAALLGGNFASAFYSFKWIPRNWLRRMVGCTIMLFNVWVLIWPNQQKILGLKPASDAEKLLLEE